MCPRLCLAHRCHENNRVLQPSDRIAPSVSVSGAMLSKGLGRPGRDLATLPSQRTKKMDTKLGIEIAGDPFVVVLLLIEAKNTLTPICSLQLQMVNVCE